MGDFNVNWEDRVARKNLKQICDHFNLTQVVKGPTRITHNTETQIDLIFCNKPERITKSFNMITGLSDHNLVLVTRKLTSSRFGISTVKEKEVSRIPNKVRDDFIDTINRSNWSNLLDGKNVHDGSTVLTSRLQYFIKEFTHKFRNRNYKNCLPWITAEILNMMKERDLAKKKANKSNFKY